MNSTCHSLFDDYASLSRSLSLFSKAVLEVCTGPGLAQSPASALPAGWAGPANEREFFQWARPDRQKRNEF